MIELIFTHRLLLGTRGGPWAGSWIFGTHKSRNPYAEDIVSSRSSPPYEESVVPRNVDHWYKCNDQPLTDVYLDASPRKPKGKDIICHSQYVTSFFLYTEKDDVTITEFV